MVIRSSRAIFCILICLFVSPKVGFCQGFRCWELLAGDSCESVFGPRLPNEGCSGCNNAHSCIEPDNALWSAPLDKWDDIHGVANPFAEYGRESYDPKNVVCAKKFDCETLCEIKSETGNWECVPKDQPPNWLWWIDYDDLAGDDCHP